MELGWRMRQQAAIEVQQKRDRDGRERRGEGTPSSSDDARIPPPPPELDGSETDDGVESDDAASSSG
eukprot:3271029-Prymnesium_polylepis.1